MILTRSLRTRHNYNIRVTSLLHNDVNDDVIGQFSSYLPSCAIRKESSRDVVWRLRDDKRAITASVPDVRYPEIAATNQIVADNAFGDDVDSNSRFHSLQRHAKSPYPLTPPSMIISPTDVIFSSKFDAELHDYINCYPR